MPHIVPYRTVSRPHFVHPRMVNWLDMSPNLLANLVPQRNIGAYSSRVRLVVVSWCVVYEDEYDHQFACVQARSASVKAGSGGPGEGEGVRGIPFFLFSFFLLAYLLVSGPDDGLPMPHSIPAGTRDRG
jgi:hypothetical protein